MAAILSFGINKDKFDQLDWNEKGWANITVIIDDETNTYGQNAKITKEQSKEEREAKNPKVYLGNGKVVWTDGSVNVADKVEKQVTSSEQSMAGRETPDLPF